MKKATNGNWVEVMVVWGEHVLAVRHLSFAELEAGKSFTVGDGSEPCDFVVAQDELGVSKFALVDAVLGVPHVHMPARMSPANEPSMTTTWADGSAIPLSAEQKTTVELGSLRFHVRLATPEEAPRTAFVERFDRSAFASFLTTFGVAGALFTALALATPPLWASEDDKMTPERLLLIQQYLDASALREEKLEEVEASSGESPESTGKVEKSTPTAEPSKRPTEGSAGGPKRSDKPGPSRAEMLAEARTGGMIALLTSTPPGVFSEFGTTPSAAGQSFGDPGMFTSGIGEVGGFGSLSGIGEGAGGIGAGIGINGVGNGLFGRGLPGGPGGPGTFGNGPGGPGGRGHKPGVPTMRTAVPNVSGHMPPEVIQRVVRQNFGRMRMCYEQGLGRNPNLEGRVEVRFMIGRDGRVGSAAAGSSTLPDSAVTSCVVSVFYAIGFPPPEDGTVRVTYPISFTPS